MPEPNPDFTFLIPSLNVTLPLISTNEQFDRRLENIFHEGTRGHFFAALNSEKIMLASKDAELSHILQNFSLNFADGIGVVWAAKILTRARLERIWAFSKLLKTIHARRGSIYLFGTDEQTNQMAQKALRSAYPGIQKITGCSGFNFDSREVVKRIREFQPDLLTVGLGSPHQEKWIKEFGRETDSRVMMGVGGAIDVLGGTRKRAPRWCQTLGFEWLYRLLTEPSRARRQLVLPIFAYHVLRDRLLVSKRVNG